MRSSRSCANGSRAADPQPRADPPMCPHPRCRGLGPASGNDAVVSARPLSNVMHAEAGTSLLNARCAS